MRWFVLIFYVAVCALAGRVLSSQQRSTVPEPPERQLQARCQSLLEEVVGAGNVRVEVYWQPGEGISGAVLVKGQSEGTAEVVQNLARGCLGIPEYGDGGDRLRVVNWSPGDSAASPERERLHREFIEMKVEWPSPGAAL